jgi:hypothetical protein
MTINELKQEALVLIGWLAPGEDMTADDCNQTLHTIITRIHASPECTPARAALIAAMLAERIDN